MKPKPKPDLPRRVGRLKYRQRNINERMFCWLKESRGIVTLFDKLAKSYAEHDLAGLFHAVYDTSFRLEPISDAAIPVDSRTSPVVTPSCPAPGIPGSFRGAGNGIALSGGIRSVGSLALAGFGSVQATLRHTR